MRITSLRHKFNLMYKKRVLKMSNMDIKIAEWKKAGVTIGENCRLYCDRPIDRDAFLLTIGNNVTVSGGTVFLCHDNSAAKVSNNKFTDIFGKITIGNNCFIGNKTIVLPGVTLADNTIVGAGSVVTHSFLKEGCIIAGNPARIIGTADSFYEKNQQYMINADGMSNDEFKQYILQNSEKLIVKTSKE